MLLAELKKAAPERAAFFAKPILPVFAKKLEVRLRMVAGTARVRRVSSLVEVSAVAAAPGDRQVAMEDLPRLEV